MKTCSILTLLIINSFMASTQNISEKLDKKLQEYHDTNGISHSLLVVHNNKLLYNGSEGHHKMDNKIKTNDRSMYRMASVSKQFTAAAIYKLILQKKLKASQSIKEFFPDFASVGNDIRIQYLLSHSSGIYDYEELMSDTITQQLSDYDILKMVEGINTTYFTPGSQFKYSNTAYCLLALIVEKVAGMSLQDYCKKNIFDPLDMKNTVWYGGQINNRVYGYAFDKSNQIVFNDQSLTSASLGDGGLYTSLSDYLKWYQGRKKIVGLDFSQMEQLASKSITKDYLYSFGWFYKKQGKEIEILLHSGATCGFSNIVVEIPETNTFIAYFTNLADYHNSFVSIETILKQANILPHDFSYTEMHQQTH